MINTQFDMTAVRRKPAAGFRWEHKWLVTHEAWMWVKVYDAEKTPNRPWRVRPTSKKHNGGKTAILREMK